MEEKNDYTAINKCLMIIKPDGMQYFGEIIEILNRNKIKILSIKSRQLNKTEVEEVYRDHKGRYFFGPLVDYMTMGKCCVFAIKADFSVIESAKKQIRLFAREFATTLAGRALAVAVNQTKTTELVDVNEYITNFLKEYQRTFDGIHCSDIDSAERELEIFFESSELCEFDFNLERSVEIVSNKVQLAQENQRSLIDKAFENYSPNFFNK